MTAHRRAVLPAILAFGVYLLGGCPKPSGPVRLEPTSVPPPFVAIAPGTARKSALFLTGGKLNIRVKDSATGLRVPRTSIGIFGPTLAGGISGSTFDLSFQPLVGGAYKVVLQAPGYVTKVLQSQAIAGRAVGDSKVPETGVEVSLDPAPAPIKGQVVDGAGKPLAGVLVHEGVDVAFTGADGTFALGGLSAGAHTLRFRRTGFGAVTRSANSSQDLGRVALASEPVVVDIENASNVLGTSPASSVIAGLKTALRAAGATVKENDAAGANVMVFVGPGSDEAGKAATAEQFVRSGGKLVVMGEWGGVSGYSPDAANALLAPMGLAIEVDLIRSAQNGGKTEWPLAAPVAPFPFLNGQIHLFHPASVFWVAPALPILRTIGGYRVAALAGDPVAAAAAPFGDGLAVAIGETSAWTDSNTTGHGPDLDRGDNRSFVVNLILW